MKSVAALFALGWSAAYAAAPLIHLEFENDVSGWVTMGASGSVRVERDAANVKDGRGALAFDYTAAPKSFSAAVFPVAEGALGKMKMLRFWLKTDAAAAIGVIASEKAPGGDNFTALVWSPKNTWQLIELTPADFALNEGPAEPKDGNGKLELDRLQGLGLIDVSQMFGAAKPNPDFPIAIEPHGGKHTLYVDDFEALDTAPAWDTKAAAGGVTIDDFRHPQLSWLTLGGADLSLDTSGKPVAGRAMKVSYKQSQGSYAVLVHSLAGLDLSGNNKLAFDIASEKPAQLIIAFEERMPGKGQGPRYNVDVEVPGGGKAAHREVALGAFQPDENGMQDPNGKLDLDRIKSMSIVDVTGALSGGSGANTVWIGNIQAVARP